ncbi:MAG: adenylate cyclase [Phycisphaerae bacterium]|nr:adenylate cyclase [Phycisphaerae bacterium]
MNTPSNLEIERAWLLNSMPVLPGDATSCTIRQGYLPLDQDEPGARGQRLRATTTDDGMTIYHHTTKEGIGLVRTEIEQEISREQFDQAWPLTEGRRLSKIRHRACVGDLTWEIDVFDQIKLILAEVELPGRDHLAEIPRWLAPCIEREVTDDPRYRNARIALEWINRS